MNCQQIDQSKADSLLRKLNESDFNEAFQEERDRKQKGEAIWALPSADRTYYIVSIEDTVILLAGINKYINISSFAKIPDDQRFRGKGRLCVKKLIETILIPRINKEYNGRDQFHCRIASNKGKKVMDYILENLPDGIRNITNNGDSYSFHIW